MTKINNILKNIILAGLFVVLSIPFYVDNSIIFPFIAGKDFAFRLIIEIIFAVWIILCLRDKSFIPKKTFLLTSFSIFIAVIFLADIFAVNKTMALWSNYERMDGFVRLIHIYAFFLMISSIIRTSKLWNYFLGTSVLSSILMSFYGIFQLAGKTEIHQGGVRLDGTLGNATYLAVFMLFNIFFAIYLIYRYKNLTLRIILGLVLVLQSIILYYTATRGVILGLISGLLLTAIISSIISKDKIIKKIGVWSIVTIVVIVGLFISFKDTSLVKNSPVLGRLASISLEDKTTLSRFIVWDIAWQGFKERPLLGWGQGNFNLIYDKYYDVRMYDQEQWFDRAHNVVMDWLVAGGILGLLSYLSILASALLLIWKKNRFDTFEKSLITGLLVAYVFQNLFVFDHLVSYILFAVLLALINNSVNQRGLEDEPLIGDVNARLTVSVFVVIACVFTLYFVNVNSYLTSRNIHKGLSLHFAQNQVLSLLPKADNVDDNLNYFKKALQKEDFGSPEARIQLLSTAKRISKTTNVDNISKQNFIKLALEEMEKQLEKTPFDAKYNFAMGSSLAELKELETSQIYLEKALNLSPKKHVIRDALTQVYSLLNQHDRAIAFGKETYEMETRSDDSWVIYVSALVRAEKDDEYARLINEAIEKKQYERVEKFMKIAINQNPNNLQSYVSLAVFYDQIGNNSFAIQVLEIAKQRFPNQVKLLDSFIKKVNEQ